MLSAYSYWLAALLTFWVDLNEQRNERQARALGRDRPLELEWLKGQVTGYWTFF